ncbi:hypothetical protein [Terasakiella pusilla]|uniref:hypothetical protein n=1 Tax=Terasakiella pusilla TaxID=64973 RepID=UPI003AA8FE93
MLDWIFNLSLSDQLALAGFVVAAVVAWAAIAANKREKQRDKRKPPIFEISTHAHKDNLDWTTITVTVRNSSEVSAKVTKVCAPRGVLIMHLQEAYIDGPTEFDPPKLANLRKSMGAKFLDVSLVVAPVGERGSQTSLGDVDCITLLAHGWREGAKLSFDHQWLDGHRP